MKYVLLFGPEQWSLFFLEREDLFFKDHLILDGKIVSISVKTFFLEVT